MRHPPASRRLARWMRAHGVTQRALAESTGYTRAAISAVARGISGASPPLRLALEHATAGAVPVACWERPVRLRRKVQPMRLAG